MVPSKKERQPWPMKWIVLAIVVFIIPYTYLTLKYRKPGKAFEPYHDMKDQANTLRLLQAGYQRIDAPMERPAEESRFAMVATTEPKVGGLSKDLRATLLDTPVLPSRIEAVRAPAIITADMAYSVEFMCVLPDEKHEPLNAALYVRGSEILILPNFERIAEGLAARTPSARVRITVPPRTLKSGSYEVTLVGDAQSRSWALQVH